MRYYFAPMEGVTGWLFRQAHRHWFSGVDRYFMPFLSPRQEHAFTRREASDFLPEHNRGLYAVPSCSPAARMIFFGPPECWQTWVIGRST